MSVATGIIPHRKLRQAGRDDLDPPPEVGSRPGGVPALQKKKDKRRRWREEEEQRRIHIVFWDRRLLGLGDLSLRLCFLVEVSIKIQVNMIFNVLRYGFIIFIYPSNFRA